MLGIRDLDWWGFSSCKVWQPRPFIGKCNTSVPQLHEIVLLPLNGHNEPVGCYTTIWAQRNHNQINKQTTVDLLFQNSLVSCSSLARMAISRSSSPERFHSSSFSCSWPRSRALFSICSTAAVRLLHTACNTTVNGLNHSDLHLTQSAPLLPSDFCTQPVTQLLVDSTTTTSHHPTPANSMQ